MENPAAPPRCPGCGHPCEVEDRFCRYCGRRDPATGSLDEAPTLYPPAQSAPTPPPAPAVTFDSTTPVKGSLFAGRYRIERLVGEGGMGRVWKAVDETIDEPVALKVLAPAYASDPALLEQFKRELKLARRVRQRNVVQSFDLGFAGKTCFISMEFVDAENLASFLRRLGPLPEADALRLLRQVLKGLRAAHELGIVHRDIKAANILVNADRVAFITDFGIATPASLVPELSAGTPEYMAPELYYGEKVVAATDLYACGILLHVMLTGTPPFRAATFEELGRAHITREPDAVPGSAETRRLHRDLLRKEAEERPCTAAAVLERVDAILAKGSLTVRTTRPIALVVESDASMLDLYAQSLAKAGFHVLTADDAQRGLSLAFENDLSVILLDESIRGGLELAPEADGEEPAEPESLPGLSFCRVLGRDEKLSRVPVVVTTAVARPGMAEAFRLAGAKGVVTRPMGSEGLFETVRSAISAAS